MPSRAEIVSFADSAPPPGADQWVPGASPAVGIEVADPDPAWTRRYDELAGRIRQALGWRVSEITGQAPPGLTGSRSWSRSDWVRLLSNCLVSASS